HRYYNYKSDLWSIGCVIAQLILGHPLFKESKEDTMLDKIRQFENFCERFKKDLNQLTKAGKTINDYHPYWQYLKDLKQLYCFSVDLYEVLMNLLEVNPKKRNAPMRLLKSKLWSGQTRHESFYSSLSERQLITSKAEGLTRYVYHFSSLSLEQTKYKSLPI